MQEKPTFSKDPQPPETNFPEPHSMLINPATKVDTHWKYMVYLFRLIKHYAKEDMFTNEQMQSIVNNWETTGKQAWEKNQDKKSLFYGAIDIFKEIYDELTVSFTSVESIRNPSTKRQAAFF